MKKVEEGEKNKVSKNVDSIYTKKKLLWVYVLFVVVFAMNLYFNFSRNYFPITQNVNYFTENVHKIHNYVFLRQHFSILSCQNIRKIVFSYDKLMYS